MCIARRGSSDDLPSARYWSAKIQVVVAKRLWDSCFKDFGNSRLQRDEEKFSSNLSREVKQKEKLLGVRRREKERGEKRRKRRIRASWSGRLRVIELSPREQRPIRRSHSQSPARWGLRNSNRSHGRQFSSEIQNPVIRLSSTPSPLSPCKVSLSRSFYPIVVAVFFNIFSDY